MLLRSTAFVLALILAAPSLAQPDPASPSSTPRAGGPSPEARAQMRKVCAKDLETYCAEAQAGGGRLGQCLRQNFDKLSPDCQAQLKQMRASMRER